MVTSQDERSAVVWGKKPTQLADLSVLLILSDMDLHRM